MRFSTRTTYGLRAMIHLARNWDRGSVSLSKIANIENISQKYLERLLAKLKIAGLVRATKGAGGGYKLTKKPGQINIYDIIKPLEGRMSPFYCLAEDGKIYCSGKEKCGATQVLIKVQQAVNSTLKSVKLKDLI